MFDCLRKIVAGKKNRTLQGRYDLDLTYITSNIIAMAFPASGFQKIYRNCIQDVADYLNQKHTDNYYIINVSNRQYQHTLFKGRVQNYGWQDHQAPCLTTLFQIIEKANNKLQEKEQNVIAVHCNHGKGRTGTAIMSILMFNNDFKTVNDVLKFYNSKRFSSQTYKVQQPCQIRYLQFVKQILDSPHNFKTLRSYRLVSIRSEGLDQKYYLKISDMRTNKVIFECLQFSEEKQSITSQILMGDIFIQIIYRSIFWSTRIARINFHLSFLYEKGNKWIACFESSKLKIKSCHRDNFRIQLQFQQFCNCHIQESIACKCNPKRIEQMKYWQKLHACLAKRQPKKNTINKKQQTISIDHLMIKL